MLRVCLTDEATGKGRLALPASELRTRGRGSPPLGPTPVPCPSSPSRQKLGAGGRGSLESQSGGIEAEHTGPLPRGAPSWGGGGLTPQGHPGWERGADAALGESQACEELGLWTGVARGGWEGRAQARAVCAQKGLPLAGPGHEGLALSPDTPQKTPQTIPSYLAKAHFFKVRRLRQQKEKGPMEGGRVRAVGEGAAGQGLRPAEPRSAPGGGGRSDQAPSAPRPLGARGPAGSS